MITEIIAVFTVSSSFLSDILFFPLENLQKLLTQEQISGVIHHHGLDLFVGHTLGLECWKEILGYVIDVPVFKPR